MHLQASTETYALLWSGSQRAFHIEPLRKMLETNRSHFADGRVTDYVPIYLGTDEQCRQASHVVQESMNQRCGHLTQLHQKST